MSKQVRIGTCGYGRTPKETYYEKLECIEIQHTFYQPPQIKTLEKWREQASDDFEFTLKVWQLVTHAHNIRTYRRLKRELTEQEREELGYFKPTPIVQEGWETTFESAKALRAKTVLFQCPASLKPTLENIANIRNFFSELDAEGLTLCWEPRGKWEDDTIREICDEFGLWHTVDPFERRTVTPDRCYFRLHGRNGWRYKYEEAELEELAAMLPAENTSYVFFNNREMFDDAQIFREIVKNLDD